MKLIYKLLAGRPMKFDGSAFFDTVAMRPVNFYIDGFGRRWMAHTRWSWFRVERAI